MPVESFFQIVINLLICFADLNTISQDPSSNTVPSCSSQIPREISPDLHDSQVLGEIQAQFLHDSQVPGEIRAQGLQDLCGKHNIADIELGQKSIYKFLVADDSKKSVYCAVSKCASSTWKNALFQMHGGDVRDSMAIHQKSYLEKKGLVFLTNYSQEEAEYRMKHYFKYMIVRHPFDRLVSAWRDKLLGDENYIKVFIPRIRAPSRLSGTETTQLKPEKPIEFTEFVDYLAKQNPLHFDRHWLSMYHHCHPCHFRYDFVAKVETLSADLPHLYNALYVDEDLQLRIINEHSKDSPHFSTHYDPVMVSTYKKLRSFYYVDMTLFNYTDPIFP